MNDSDLYNHHHHGPFGFGPLRYNATGLVPGGPSWHDGARPGPDGPRHGVFALVCMTTIALYILNLFVAVVGIAGNLVVIAVFFLRRKLWTVPNCFIVNLAITDFVYLMAIVIVFILRQTQVLFYIGTVLSHVTVFSLTFLSLDRYAAIAYPLSSKPYRINRNAVIACLAVWIVSVVGNTFVFEMNWQHPVWFAYYIFATAYAIPVVVIVGCYVPILCVVLRRKKMSASQPARGRADNGGIDRKRKLKTLRTVLVVVASFVLCWGLFHVVNIVIFYEDFEPTDVVLYVWYLFPTINSSLNPFLYALTNRNFVDVMPRPWKRSEGGVGAPVKNVAEMKNAE